MGLKNFIVNGQERTLDYETGVTNKPDIYTKTQTDAKISEAINNLVNGAEGALDTLGELAEALGNDENFATTITNKLASKADKTVATTTSNGLMSAADKTKLDNISSDDVGTVTQVKVGDTTYDPTNGVISLPKYAKSSELVNYTLSTEFNEEVDRLDGLISAITGSGSGEDIPTLDNVYTKTQVAYLLYDKVDKSTTVNGHALNSDVTITKKDISLDNVTNDAQVKRSEMGVARGVATLDTNGRVPTSQLPSYVDDVIEYSNSSDFPSPGETGKIYVETSTNKTYRWSGSYYVEITSSLALGETSSTAYAGDKGAANASNISKIIDGTTTVGKAVQATTIGNDTIGDTNTPIYLNAGTPTKLGFTIAKSVPSDAIFTDTTYENATVSKAGLMSVDDKKKLDGIQTSADAVSFTQVLSSGTHIGTININGTDTKIYCEKGGATGEFLPLSGGTMSGPIASSTSSSSTRMLHDSNRNSGIKYDYGGKEALIISSGTYNNSSIVFFTTGQLDMKDSTHNQWNSATPSMQIKNGTVGINKLHNADGTFSYNLDVNGSANATTLYENGSALSGKYLSIETAAATYIPKTTYEWNREVAFGQTGVLYIGAFPMYDSNITVDIDATTSTTYHATLVIATQNINNTGGGSLTATVYGDATNTITPNIYIAYVSGSNNVRVYFKPQSWSKNLIHIRCVSLAGTPTNICSDISSLPSDATKKPTNALLSNYLTLDGGQLKGSIKLPSDGGGIATSSGYNVIGCSSASSISIGNNYATISIMKLSSLTAPTSSGGTSYGVGSTGQVLKSNGSTIYWGDETGLPLSGGKTLTGNVGLSDGVSLVSGSFNIVGRVSDGTYYVNTLGNTSQYTKVTGSATVINNVSNFTLKGSTPTVGQVLTASNSSGSVTWKTLPNATTSAAGLMSTTDKSRLDVLSASQLLQVKYNPVELTGSAATLSLSVANGFKGLPIAIYSIKESSSENIIRSAIVPLFSNVTCSTGIKSTQGDEICLYYDTSAKTVYERHGEGWNKATSYRRLMVIDLATAV